MMLTLCYHQLSDVPTNPWTLSPASFREHLQILKSRGYRSVSLDSLQSAPKWEDRTVAITFDDGRDGCMSFADELLAEFQFSATFYICTSFADSAREMSPEAYSRFMDWNTIQTLAAKGHTIGSHTVSHVSFQELTQLDRAEELVQSKRMIEDRIGQPCHHFAAPYGFLDHSSCLLALELGYVSAASTIPGVNRSPSSLPCLRRCQITSPCSREEFSNLLNSMEDLSSFYRVAIVPAETDLQATDMTAIARLAEYDLVLSPNRETKRVLTHFNVRCEDTREFGLGNGTLETSSSSPARVSQEYASVAIAIKQFPEVPLECRVQIHAF